MPKPSGEWLDDDVSHYRAIGIDVIVSLLTEPEALELRLADEKNVCNAHGIEFVQLPIPDRGLPDLDEFAKLVEGSCRHLAGGKTIGVHCRAGIGRSGMLICCILKQTGLSANEAVSRVSTARGVQVPDTDEQLAFIDRYTGSI
jgi:protein-tyrosine phosphatase